MTNPRNGTLFLLIWLTLNVLSTTQVLADGAYFSRQSGARSGDQRVIIIKNGDQISMTFSTSYTGEGEDFAWIIPSPVPLTIEDIGETDEIGLNLFKLLDYSTAPWALFYAGKPGWGPAQRLVTVYRTLPLEHCEVSVLGTAGALPLLEWLRENGYQVDLASKKVLDSYAQENWCFVAVKLKPSENRHYENEALPPITISYRSGRLVFPLRIASVSTTQTARITLYVIAESTVSSANLRTTPLVQGRIEDLKDRVEMAHSPGSEDPGAEVQRWIGDIAAAGDLVVVWKGECQQSDTLEQMMEDPFPPGTNIYLTRLEARIEPATITEDIELILDTSPERLQVALRDLRTAKSRVAPTPGEARPPAKGRVPDLSGVTAIAAADDHTVALKVDGTVWAWGDNRHGGLGDGSTTSRSVPIPVPRLSGVVAIAARGDHTVALNADGTVWTWGSNEYGQLGDGTTMDRFTPVQVPGFSVVTAVTAGDFQTIALKRDGTVWAWGRNDGGQLGVGGSNNCLTPVQVPTLSGVTAIAAGGWHTLALKSDGTVWAWGYNGHGQLGDGSTTHRFLPVRVSRLSGIMGIAAGGSHSVALKDDGTVWAWGYNGHGQLGDGTKTNRFLPVQVKGLSCVVRIAAGDSHNVALKDDGTVCAWGSNNKGQLGDGTRTDRFLPVQVSGLSGVTAIAASSGYHWWTYYTVALTEDGTVCAWGSNGSGQLGFTGTMGW
jgi:alpha-tubulin suppressor-like RCC1 family protein